MDQNRLLQVVEVSEEFQRLVERAAQEVGPEADSVTIGLPVKKLSTSPSCRAVINEFHRTYIKTAESLTSQRKPESTQPITYTYTHAVFLLQSGDVNLKDLASTVLIPIMGFGDRLTLKVQVAEASAVVEARRDCVFMIPGVCRLETSGSGKIVCIMLGLKE